MYKVVVSTNDSRNKSITATITKRQYRALEDSQNVGGFKRYDVELYSDDEPKKPTDFNWVIGFLAIEVFKTSSESVKKMLV